MTMKPDINSYLPFEIIFEILSWLTVDSLLRCTTVCKRWRSIVSDHHFIKAHLRLSSMNKDFHRIVFVSRTSLALRTCSVQSLLHDSCVDTVDIDNSKVGNRNWARIVGSCNGLICISGLTYTLSIWNLSTKRSRRLIFSCPEGAHSGIAYGFGYDESSDDYKVVMIYRGAFNKACVSVYSLRTNSWRRILDFPHGVPLGSTGKFVNGALHWVFTTGSNNKPWVIVALDLGYESYREVLQPNYGEGDFVLELGVLGGCLCVVCDFHGSRADIWVMKEYGVRESWTKLVSIPYMMDPRWSARYSNPLFVSDKGEILLELRNRLVVYNPERNTVKYVNVQNYDASLEVYSYVESLVSPLHSDL